MMGLIHYTSHDFMPAEMPLFSNNMIAQQHIPEEHRHNFSLSKDVVMHPIELVWTSLYCFAVQAQCILSIAVATEQ